MKIETLLAGALLCAGPATARPFATLECSIQDYPRYAPYSAVRWKGDTPEVRHGGTFYELLELESHSAAELVAFAKKTYGRRWSKRIAEDIVQVLTEIGTPPGSTVRMRLLGIDNGEELVLPAVTMTLEKRRAVMEFTRGEDSAVSAPRPAAKVQRTERRHAKRMPAKWKTLMAPEWLGEGVEGWSSPELAADVIERDLDQLEWILEDQYSYLHMLQVDYRGALDALRIAASEGLPRDVFALQLRKFLGLFGDGHTRLDESLRSMLPAGCAPYLLFETADGIACIRGDRSGPVDDQAPYLAAIDGIGIERWIEASQLLTPAGSRAWVRGRAIENLRYIGWVALELGHDLGGTLELTLTDGKTERIASAPVERQRAMYGSWPRRDSAMLDDNIGYLRIPSMEGEPAFLKHVQAWMESFAEAEGLIIDVRGNGGGTRDALSLIYPMLMDSNEAPAVVNVAKYKLRERDQRGAADGYLENRALYPAGWKGWNADERAAIESFAADFKPTWKPDPGGFSDWHYMVISPASGGPTFTGPVVLLIDGGCFSATDIFASALAARSEVSVLGQPTGGGSGRSRGAILAGSGLRLRLSSMASFQASGQPYDGVGVHPDTPIVQPAEYSWGGHDAVLEAALKALRRGE